MGKKILLADDSITIQKVIELTFSDEDFDVVTVGNGRLAVERVQEVRPDVVLCDIIMPEKDGYEVCDFIKRHPQLGHIPVLLLTGAFEPFDQERAARVGCDGFLAKPFEPQTLIAKVKDLLGQSGMRRGAPPPSRPVATTAAAAPTPPALSPFEPAPMPAQAPESIPGTSPAGVASPFTQPRPPVPAPAPAPRAPVPEPAPAPAPVQAPLRSEFEMYYPTPEELEPLAASPEFEPVFAPTDFEPVEPQGAYDTVEVPVVEFPEAAPEPPSRPAWGAPEPAPPTFISDEPGFIPEEPFGDVAPRGFASPAPVATPEVADELFMVDTGMADGEAPRSEARPDTALEDRAAASGFGGYEVPAPPSGFEESFDEPVLLLEPDSESRPLAAAPPEPPRGPDERMSDALFAAEGEFETAETPVEELERTAVAAFGELMQPDAEEPAGDGGLFTALGEEEAALGVTPPTPAASFADEFPPELPDDSFSETEPALPIAAVEFEPDALELEPEAEPLVASPAPATLSAGAAAVERAHAGFRELEFEASIEPPPPVPAFEPPPAPPAIIAAAPAPALPQVESTPAPEVRHVPAAPEAALPPVAEELSFEGVAPAAAVAAPESPSTAAGVAVPMEMVEQIARRVVAQLGDKVIREVAWEVVPDLAEALIRREISRLRAELDRLP